MNKSGLSEKEFEIINLIGDGFRRNQRQISEDTGLSLGMTNLLLRRLATKGYLRIRQLNRKKVEYFLTGAGFTEKIKKTYHYTLKTLESLGTIRSEIRRLLALKLTSDIKRILVLGEGDLTDLTVLALQELSGAERQITRVVRFPIMAPPQTLLIDASTRLPALPYQRTEDSLILLESLVRAPSSKSHAKMMSTGKSYPSIGDSYELV